MIDGKTVELEWHEMLLGAIVGALRNIISLKRKSVPGHGHNGQEGWQANIEGALGELAFAKKTKRYPGFTINTYKAPDVGPYQVRTCGEGRRLLVRPDDDAEQVFVLVTGQDGIYRLRGWMTAGEARQVGDLDDLGHPERPLACVVIPEQLHPIEELPDAPDTDTTR